MSSANGALLAQARKAIKTGRKEHARQLLHQAARQDPADYRPWLYLAGLSPSPVASRAYLDRAAALNPVHPDIERVRTLVEGRLEPASLSARDESQPARTLWRDVGWTLTGALLLLVMIAFAGTFAFLWPLRLSLGLAFVLFVPGYWLVTALFPRSSELEGIERLALSFGLSVAVIAPLALLLDWLPWGIRLWPILLAYGLYYAILMPLAIYRRRRLPPEERYRPHIQLDLKGWWAAQDRVNRIIYFVLLGATLLATFSAAAILWLPKAGEQFTEFYMLGPEGLAENFPRQAAPGQPLTVTLGITNHERYEHTYHVEVWAVDPFSEESRQLVAQSPPQTLPTQGTIEWPLTWSMPKVYPGSVATGTGTGADQQVEFLLYIDSQPAPYRRLLLWLDVAE